MIKLLMVVVLCISSMRVFSESNDEFSGKCSTFISSEKYKEGFEWCLLAAEQGDADAQVNLGFMYFAGKGVTQDYKQAAKWYALSAEQGNVDAQYWLGAMHGRGKGVTQDYKQAVKWQTLAAEQGDADAQLYLGFMYKAGKGVLEDNVYAHMWFNIASSNGSSTAPKSRDIVAKAMTKEQIAEAQKLARECVAKEYKRC